MASQKAEAAVLKACPKSVDSDVSEYIASTAASLLEDDDMDAESFREEFGGTVEELFEDNGVSAEDTKVFLDTVIEAAFGKPENGKFAPPPRAKKYAGDDSGPSNGKLLCCIPDLLLMYGGSPEPLLRNTTLKLVQSHRYGVIGTNGSGKTTLMSRIAKKDIGGFPKDINVVHLRHEAILKGINPSISAREYAKKKNTGETAASDEDLMSSLKEVGFDSEELLSKSVGALSGGWQMRLALACATAQKANLLLLDEPTNHLDSDAVKWLVEYVNEACSGETGCTAILVSHDPVFLNQVCTDIIHFTSDAKLQYREGNFDEFKAQVLKGDEEKARLLLEVGGKNAEDALPSDDDDRLVFPTPERIAGSTQAKPDPVVLTVKDVTFRHKGADVSVINNVSTEICYGAKVGIKGKNGAGKSTLLSLMAGRLKPNVSGEIWQHDSLRAVYIAQHSEEQLADYVNGTASEYLQLRYRKGYDKEAPHRPPPKINPKEQSRIKGLADRNGKYGRQVEELLARHIDHENKECYYEVKWEGLTSAENTFEKMSRLQKLGLGHLVAAFNEYLNDTWGSEQPRPLTQREVAKHFGDFGLPEDAACERRIDTLSSGQRVKLLLAASFWTKPHLAFLDEPTNYLDQDTVEALQKALCNFKGGCVVVSHNDLFMEGVCEEIWDMADGEITAKNVNEKRAGAKIAEQEAAQAAAKGGAKKKAAGK